MTIFIGNLSWDTEEEDLKDLFNTYGEVKKCTIPLDRDSRRKRGFGFVEMESGAEDAIQALNDSEVDGRKLVVNESKPKEDR